MNIFQNTNTSKKIRLFKTPILIFLWLMASNSSFGQILFKEVSRKDRIIPLPIAVDRIGRLVAVDLDEDGDTDFVSGDVEGNLHFFRNTEGHFTEVVGKENILDTINAGIFPSPAFIDADNDNDMDMVLGFGSSSSNTLKYYERIGNAYYYRTGDESPFFFGSLYHPEFVDLDGDGDFDMVTGEPSGSFEYAENEDGVFFQKAISGQNPLENIYVSGYSSPEFYDVDGDNDLDLVSGDRDGNFNLFLNNKGTYEKAENAANPFSDISVNSYSTPFFFDIDGDSDMDLISGNGENHFELFRNDNGTFVHVIRENPLYGFDAINTSTPTFTDIDGDNDLDMISGNLSGNFKYYQNINGVYYEMLGKDNPFGTITVASNGSATFADLDGDNDLDMMTGDNDYTSRYFKNENGVFIEQTDNANPFDDIFLDKATKPLFFDWDNDNDMDVLCGNLQGDIIYLENDNMTFTKKTGVNNPFYGLKVGSHSSAVAVSDLDKDGDKDILMGDFFGKLYYYRNDQTGFTLLSGIDNPFEFYNQSNHDYEVAPAFVDLDKDGDQDLIMGRSDGTFYEFRNESNIVSSIEKVVNATKTLTVAPVPTSSSLHVSDNGSYVILNIMGTIVQKGFINDNYLSVDKLPVGQYILRIGESNTKFIKD